MMRTKLLVRKCGRLWSRARHVIRCATAIGFAAGLSACSPYVYKAEINGLSTGVGDLSTAFRTALQDARADRTNQLSIRWMKDRPALTGDNCGTALNPALADASSCVLREPGARAPQSSPIVMKAADAAPIVKALQDYAAALAAVSNAADRQAFDSATASLGKSVEGLLKAAGTKDATLLASVGPVTALLDSVAGIVLDTRRFNTLRAAVLGSDVAIGVLADALGETLQDLKVARITALTTPLNQLGDARSNKAMGFAELQYRQSSSYAARDEIAALQAVDPRKAAKDMSTAHAQLAAAMKDDTRQLKPLIATTKDFVDKAQAVRGAFNASSQGA